MADYKHKDKCCDPCGKRMQGIQGPVGIQGPKGNDGLQGPQGVPGPQGIPGSCVNCGSSDKPCECPAFDYAQLYSQLPQELKASPALNQPGQVVLFENLVHATANLDVSQAATTGVITFNKAGWYYVAKTVCATLPNLTSPLSVWGFALFKNGVVVPGSTFTAMTLSPDQISNTLFASLIIHFDAGDTLSLHNITNQPLLLAHASNGINANPNSAAMQIQAFEYV